MKFYLQLLAVGALCCVLSGCGCSKEQSHTEEEKIPPRMRDVVYTNQLSQFHKGRVAVANRAAAIRAKIAELGKEAEKSPEYAVLTNELAKCEAQSKAIRQDAMTTIRARILKDAAKKGDLKK
jgi:outer membrane PBP1 activator LpoA protein